MCLCEREREREKLVQNMDFILTLQGLKEMTISLLQCFFRTVASDTITFRERFCPFDCHVYEDRH